MSENPSGPEAATETVSGADDGADDPEAATKTVREGNAGPRQAKRKPLKLGAPLVAGDALGRFRIVELIGEGGMGAVYRATDDELGRQVAIKVLSVNAGDSAAGGSLESRLIREAQALAKLSHPNVIAIYDVARDRGLAFVAMELVEGLSLKNWLKSETRTRADVLAVMTQAGRGLAAAHAVGLVHRDFKPDNVMVGSDGRVRVLDFGLARTTGTTTTRTSGDSDPRVSEDTNSVDDVHSASPDLLASPLTRVGLVVGTPAYMAPEQHKGVDVDARSDQFSFCVTLYRALYGELPFEGKRQAEFKSNVLAGRVREPAQDKDVPLWLRTVVLRGLSAQPSARFPTMEALLAALAADPDVVRRRRRRVIALTATVVGLALVAGWALWRGRAAAIDPCSGGAAQLGGVWDPAVRERVHQAFAASGAKDADRMWSSVASNLDRYGTTWLEMSHQSCMATHVRREQPETMFALRSACLDQRLTELRALVNLLGTSDAATVQRSVDATRSLSAVSDCGDIAALTAPVALPGDLSARIQVTSLRNQLSEARALRAAGNYERGLAISKHVVEQARVLGWNPVLAEALEVSGGLLERTGDINGAERELVEAVRAAIRGRHDLVLADASRRLVAVTGYWLGQMTQAHDWARLCEATLDRLGGNDAILTDLLGDEAWTFIAEHKGDEAVDRAQRSLAMTEKLYGRDSLDVAYAEDTLGFALRTRRDAKAAEEHHLRALHRFEQLLGPEHPSVWAPLNNLALALADQDRNEEALAANDRAIAVWTSAVAGDQPNVAISLGNRGDVLRRLGRHQDAIASYERAVAINDARFSPRYSFSFEPLVGLGESYLALDKPQQAIAPLERALFGLDDATPDTSILAEAQLALADALWMTGKDRTRARELAGKAKDNFTAAKVDQGIADAEHWLASHH